MTDVETQPWSEEASDLTGIKYNYIATNQEKMSEAVLGGLTLSTSGLCGSFEVFSASLFFFTLDALCLDLVKIGLVWNMRI